MKRDLDRVRQILLKCEESKKNTFRLERGWSAFDQYQIEKMAEAGFVEINDPALDSHTVRPGEVTYSLARYLQHKTFRITWDGHDYLDAVRDEGIWKQTKNAVAETGGSVSMEITKALALGFLKKKLSQHTGFDL